MIGIKIASGDFYPIMAEGARAAKRLILTTVNDNQDTVHIDLYRSADAAMAGAVFVGRLIIDGITPKPKKEPEIELALSLDDDSTLTARAIDLETDKRKSVRVVLNEPAPGADEFSIPDFELSDTPAEQPAAPEIGAYEKTGNVDAAAADTEYSAFVPPPVEPAASSDVRISDETVYDEEPRKRNPFLIALLILLGVLALLLLGFFVYKLGARAGNAPAATPKPSPTETPEAVAAAIPTPTVEPTLEPTATPTVAPAPTPAPIKKPAGKNGSKGVTHRIRWGDTLWDISTRYYGTPWLYKKIARANKIKNPDLIISGRKLWIPPR
jgi:nucleoid-associated protein YgaU